MNTERDGIRREQHEQKKSLEKMVHFFNWNLSCSWTIDRMSKRERNVG